MSRYNYCDTTDRIYFKKDAKTAKELIISEDACDRLNDLERQLAETREFIEKYGEFRNALSKTDKLTASLQLDTIYLQLKEKGK